MFTGYARNDFSFIFIGRWMKISIKYSVCHVLVSPWIAGKRPEGIGLKVIRNDLVDSTQVLQHFEPKVITPNPANPV